MHILAFTTGVEFTYTKSCGSRKSVIEPQKDYLFSNIQRVHLASDEEVTRKIFRQSLMEARLGPFKANLSGGNGEKLLFYAGAGGYGDQLMVWPVARLLNRAGYIVDVLVDPGNEPLWQEIDFIRRAISLPVLLNDLRGYDHMALHEFVTNADGHPGQLHPTDNLLMRCGIDFRGVPDADKRVRPVLTVGEMLTGARWSGCGIYQLASSNALRNLLPEAAVNLLLRLRAETGIIWHAVADKFLPTAYYDKCKEAGIQLVAFDDMRELMAVTCAAQVVVGPDSLLMHVRGMAELPAVTYFGILPPQVRTLYYPSVQPIWVKEACPYAPCYTYTNVFQDWCPGRPRQNCDVVAAAPDKVVEAVKAILQKA